MADEYNLKKSHKARHAGVSAEKKAKKNKHVQELTPRQRNPKAFGFNSINKAREAFCRSQNLQAKKHHIPYVSRTPVNPAPTIVAVVGGPKVGKSTIIRGLVKNFTRKSINNVSGPITLVGGKNKRYTFIEVNNDINCMIDMVKIADIVLLVIDITFGIEMEVLELLEIGRVHGLPRILGVINHIDMMKKNKRLSRTMKLLKRRFQAELYPGAKLFRISGVKDEQYHVNEMKNLARYISIFKPRPLMHRISHPYVLVDRFEDITDIEKIRTDPKCDRNVVLYGYVRGVPLKMQQKVHIFGCGDFVINDLSQASDPCPFPETLKRRSLNMKERILYAPMAGHSGIIYDKDAIYIDLQGSHYMQSDKKGKFIEPLLHLKKTIDEKRDEGAMQIYPIDRDHHDGRVRRKAYFNEEEENVNAKDDDDDIVDLSEELADGLSDNQDFSDDNEESDSEIISDDDGYEDSGESSEIQLNTQSPSYIRKKNEYPKTSLSEAKTESDGNEKENKLSKDDDYEEYLEKELMKLKNNAKSKDVKDLQQKTTHFVSKPFKASKKTSNSNVDHLFDHIQQLLSNTQPTSSTSTNNDMLSVNSKALMKSSVSDSVSCVSHSEADTDTFFDTSAKSTEKIVISGHEFSQHQSSIKQNEGDENETKNFRLEMFKAASLNFAQNKSLPTSMNKLVYGNVNLETREEPEVSDSDESDSDGLLRRSKNPNEIRHVADNTTILTVKNLQHLEDSSRIVAASGNNWETAEFQDMISDCFVTGRWEPGEEAKELLKMDDENDLEEDSEEISKDNEINEEGTEEVKDDEVLKVKAEKPKSKREMTTQERRLDKKRRLKEMFDEEYDEGKKDFFETWKEETEAQAQLNTKEFETLDDESRVQYEGFRSGMYVRMEFRGLPCEFITNQDPTYPIIVGGLLDNESTMGFVRVRMKVHRWYPKILKSQDPLILSVGWRRFQTLMYYAKREDDFRLRSLKYAQHYIHVEAIFWGPLTIASSGFVAFQNISQKTPNFRIAANGVILEADKSTKITKKLKLIGYPSKICNKSAFIESMFHSDIEATKFIGVKLQTQSGIRGILKKAMKRKGSFRATFEDKILMADVVILKTWAEVEVAKFYSVLKTLLLPINEKMTWKGMRTISQLRKDKGIPVVSNEDSLYKPVLERVKSTALVNGSLPRSLLKAQPIKFKLKHKQRMKMKQPNSFIVKDPHEVEMDTFVKKMRILMKRSSAKQKQEKKATHLKRLKDIEVIESRKQKKRKEEKTAACRLRSKKSGK